MFFKEGNENPRFTRKEKKFYKVEINYAPLLKKLIIFLVSKIFLDISNIFNAFPINIILKNIIRKNIKKFTHQKSHKIKKKSKREMNICL